MNRKQRRAKNSTDHISSADDIPLSAPQRTQQPRNSKTKTLLELAAERQVELLGANSSLKQNGQLDSTALRPENIVQVRVDENGEIIQEGTNTIFPQPGNEAAVEETPWLDTTLLTTTLTFVHFTLSLLAMHQYAEKVYYRPLLKQTLLIAFPTLLFLLSFFRGLVFRNPHRNALPLKWNIWLLRLRSLVWVVTANVAGCYLIQLTNDRGYYAVMKDAPSVGTIWVWCVIEMGLLGAVVGVAGPGLYAWWYGYGIY